MSLRTEENKKEFKEASRAATIFKYAANRYVAKLNIQGTMTGKMLAVVQADTANIRGERVFNKLNIGLLKNKNVGKHSVQSLVYNSFSSKIEDNAGEKSARLKFGIPLVPAVDAKKPQGATHLEITAVVVAIDFSNTDNLPIVAEQKETLGLNSSIALSEIATTPVAIPESYTVFNLIEVHFSQEVNGIKYPLESKILNACYIADAV